MKLVGLSLIFLFALNVYAGGPEDQGIQMTNQNDKNNRKMKPNHLRIDIPNSPTINRGQPVFESTRPTWEQKGKGDASSSSIHNNNDHQPIKNEVKLGGNNHKIIKYNQRNPNHSSDYFKNNRPTSPESWQERKIIKPIYNFLLCGGDSDSESDNDSPKRGKLPSASRSRKLRPCRGNGK